MKQTVFIALMGIFLNTSSFGQEGKNYYTIAKYTDLVMEAWHLYEAQDFFKSGQKYSEAFAAVGDNGMVNDRYNAACAWALAHQKDSSFTQLFKIASNGDYTNYDHLVADPDLKFFIQRLKVERN